MGIDDESTIAMNSVKGIETVRPPTLNFQRVKDTKEFTEYKIVTKQNSKKK